MKERTYLHYLAFRPVSQTRNDPKYSAYAVASHWRAAKLCDAAFLLPLLKGGEG